MEHVRDVRSHLLLKLALLDRAGRDPAGLLGRQKATLEPIARAIATERPQVKGFDATLLAWRRATAAATLSFLDDVSRPAPPRILTIPGSGLNRPGQRASSVPRRGH